MKAPQGRQAYPNRAFMVLSPPAAETKWLLVSSSTQDAFLTIVPLLYLSRNQVFTLMVPSLKVMCFDTLTKTAFGLQHCTHFPLSRMHGYSKPCLHSKWRDFTVERAERCPTYGGQWPNFSPISWSKYQRDSKEIWWAIRPVLCSFISASPLYLLCPPGP